MLKLVRTNADHPDFVNLVSHLNGYLKTVDGEDHDFYMQYNGLEGLNQVVMAYFDDICVGCGAFKPYDGKSVEIKRMFTKPEYREKQIATKILKELEIWAKELGNTACVLETGKRQIEAVHFYQKNNYKTIENFGQYKGVKNSICFEKKLI